MMRSTLSKAMCVLAVYCMERTTPVAIMIAAMFFGSLWFTFRDSFSTEDETQPTAS